MSCPKYIEQLFIFEYLHIDYYYNDYIDKFSYSNNYLYVFFGYYNNYLYLCSV